MDATTKTSRGIKVGPPTLVAQGPQNSIVLTQHDFKHHRFGTPRNSSTDPLRRLGEASKARSLSLQCMESPRRVRKAPRKVRGDALEASRSLLEETLREGFVKASPRVADSLSNDRPPLFPSLLRRVFLLPSAYYVNDFFPPPST